MPTLASAAEVLDIGYGARSIALGKTYTAVKADAYGIFGNPASLRGVTTGEIVSMYGQMSADVSYTLLGYVLPTSYGKFFAGYGNNQMTGFTSTTLDPVTGRPVAGSDFDFRSDLLMLGYENSLTKQLSFGLRLKYFSRGAGGIAGYAASGMNADAGILVAANEKLTLGLTARNIIPGETGALKLGNGQVEDQPSGVDLGVGYRILPQLGLFADLSISSNIPAEGKLGAEWKLLNSLALRLGAEQKSLGSGASYLNGSAGVGFDLGRFGIDYAYYYDSLLGTNSRHFISISIKTPKVTAPEPEFKEEVVVKAAPSIRETSKTEVVVPPPVNIPVEVVKEPTTKNIEYIVKTGDSLNKIAKKILGDWALGHKIARDNNLKNPDLIFPGQKIVIVK